MVRPWFRLKCCLLFWKFCAGSLLLRIIYSLYYWGWLCDVFIQRLTLWISSVGTELLRLLWLYLALTYGSSVVSACGMTLVWLFYAGSLCLRVSPFLSVRGWRVVLSSDGVLDELPWCGRGLSVSCDRHRPSLWFNCGFGLRTPCCLAVFSLIPLIARHPLNL